MLGIDVDFVIAKAFRDPRGLGEIVRIRPAKLQHDGLFGIAVSDQPRASTKGPVGLSDTATPIALPGSVSSCSTVV